MSIQCEPTSEELHHICLLSNHTPAQHVNMRIVSILKSLIFSLSVSFLKSLIWSLFSETHNLVFENNLFLR